MIFLCYGMIQNVKKGDLNYQEYVMPTRKHYSEYYSWAVYILVKRSLPQHTQTNPRDVHLGIKEKYFILRSSRAKLP